ncbi:hypothetical protein RI367_006752 [Sorochytrium milnesiophthora]
MPTQPATPGSPALGRWVTAFRPRIDVDAADASARAYINEAVPFANIAQLPSILEIKRQEQQKVAQKLAQAEAQVTATVKVTAKAAKAALKTLDDLAEQTDAIRSGVQEFVDTPEHRNLSQWLTELEHLQTTKRYLLCIAKAQELVARSHAQLKTSAEKAFDTYKELLALRTTEQNMLANAAHFSEYLEESLHELRQHFQETLSGRLQKALDAMGWPKKQAADGEKSEVMEAFRSAFVDMLLLQPELSGSTKGGSDTPSVLAVEVMINYLRKRFRYHFLGKRATNRLEKPEWWVQTLLNNYSEHKRFFETQVQDLLDEAQLHYLDARMLLTSELKSIGWEKLTADMPTLANHPHHLSHTVSQLLFFDSEICKDHYLSIEETDLDAHSPIGSILITSQLSQTSEWWQMWLDAELQIAKEKAQAIYKSHDAWDLVHADDLHEDEHRKTVAVDKMVELAASLTERFRQLPNAQTRYQYVAAVLLPLLQRFVSHVHGKTPIVKSPLRGLSSFTMSAPSSDPVAIERLSTLCRLISSLAFLSLVLEEWADEPFFLNLWQHAPEYNDSQTIFSSVLDNVARVQGELTDGVVDQIHETFLALTANYRSSRRFALPLPSFAGSSSPPLGHSTTTATAPATQLSSPDFAVAIQYLTTALAGMHTSLPPTLFQACLRSVCGSIDDTWMAWILRSEYSTQGALIVATDFGVLITVLRRFKSTRPELLFPRLREAVVLLCLPHKGSPSSSPLTVKTTVEEVVERAVTEHARGPRASEPSFADWIEEELDIVTLSRDEIMQVCQTRI